MGDPTGTSTKYQKYESKMAIISKLVCVLTFLFPIGYEAYYLIHCYYAKIYIDEKNSYCSPSTWIIVAYLIEVITYSLILISMVILFAYFICKARREHEEQFEKYQFRIIAYLFSMLVYSGFSTFYYWQRTIEIKSRAKDDSVEAGRNFYEPGYIIN